MLRGQVRSAAEWLAYLRGEGATEKDRDDYALWLDASPENRASAVWLSKLWLALSVLKDDPIVRSVLERHGGESGYSDSGR